MLADSIVYGQTLFSFIARHRVFYRPKVRIFILNHWNLQFNLQTQYLGIKKETSIGQGLKGCWSFERLTKTHKNLKKKQENKEIIN